MDRSRAWFLIELATGLLNLSYTTINLKSTEFELFGANMFILFSYFYFIEVLLYPQCLESGIYRV